MLKYMAKKTLPTAKRTSVSPANYVNFITSLKSKIRSSQLKAVVAVNRELIKLYWEIGLEIVERQRIDGWGTKVLERVAQDLQNEFSGIEGFSRSNLFRMKAFYLAYEKVAQAVRQLEDLPIFSIPWGHNVVLFESVERDVEQGLLDHIEKFMRELGHGFAFVGRQFPLHVSGKDFYIDLLFYHLKLRCFVVLELKATDFKPEFAGKMNFYLSAVDDLMKHSTDNPTIGILICKKKDNFIAEYALRNLISPIGIAEYETKIVSSLPKKLEGALPTVEEIEAELSVLPNVKKKVKKRRE